MSRSVSIRSYAIWVNLFFDEADIATSFDARDSNPGKIVDIDAQTHVFVQIVHRDVIAPHHRYIAVTIAHNDVRLAFDQNARAMGVECEKSEQTMQQH